jgi:hypothetical protein
MWGTKDARERNSHMMPTRKAAHDDTDAAALFERHRRTGEPLSEAECDVIIEAGLSTWDEWDQRGGGLWWHSLTWPEPTE